MALPLQMIETQAAAPDPREQERFLDDIALREVVELVRIDLPVEEVEPLLERGILPGCQLCPVRMSPAGDPIVMVEGSLLALRRETACCLCVKQPDRASD